MQIINYCFFPSINFQSDFNYLQSARVLANMLKWHSKTLHVIMSRHDTTFSHAKIQGIHSMSWHDGPCGIWAIPTYEAMKASAGMPSWIKSNTNSSNKNLQARSQRRPNQALDRCHEIRPKSETRKRSEVESWPYRAGRVQCQPKIRPMHQTTEQQTIQKYSLFTASIITLVNNVSSPYQIQVDAHILQLFLQK